MLKIRKNLSVMRERPHPGCSRCTTRHQKHAGNVGNLNLNLNLGRYVRWMSVAASLYFKGCSELLASTNIV